MASAIYYHGTNPDAAEQILGGGFGDRFPRDGPEGPCMLGGNLGNGIYLSRNWQQSLFFGAALLRCRLQRGTRIVDTSVPPDARVVDSLKREFGNELFTTTRPRKIIPASKRLTERELVELLRYHYHQCWEKKWGDPASDDWRWPPKRQRHQDALVSVASDLRRYGFHGYGHPRDENGIVIFTPDRIINIEHVGTFDHRITDSLLESLPEGTSLADFRSGYQRHTATLS